MFIKALAKSLVKVKLPALGIFPNLDLKKDAEYFEKEVRKRCQAFLGNSERFASFCSGD